MGQTAILNNKMAENAGVQIEAGTQAQGKAAQGAHHSVPRSPEGNVPGDSAHGGGMAGAGAGVGHKLAASADNIKDEAAKTAAGPPQTAAGGKDAATKKTTAVTPAVTDISKKIPENLGKVDGAPQVGVDGANTEKSPALPATTGTPPNVGAKAAAVTLSAANGGPAAAAEIKSFAAAPDTAKTTSTVQAGEAIISLPGRSNVKGTEGAGIDGPAQESAQEQRVVG